MTKPAPNWLDRVISFVAPEAGAKRAAARQWIHAFGYDAVSGDGKRGTRGGAMFRNGSPESPRITTDVVKLMWESRDMERNFCIWSGILTRTVRYAVGTIKWQSRTGDDKVDAAHELYWENWCRRADIKGQHHLRTLVQLYLRSMLRDGDVGVVLVDVGGELRLQGIEADRIGDPNRTGEYTEGKVRGIILGEGGRPETYEVTKRTRNNQYEKDKEVRAGQFVHLFDPFRLDQYRGVTWGAAAMPHMRDLYEAFQSEMIAIKFASSYAGFITSPSPYAKNAAQAWDGKSADGANKLDAMPGMVRRLQDGEEIQFAPGAARPSGAFMAFFEAKMREIGVGLDMPFGFIWDLSSLGGVTARIEVAQVKRSLSHYRLLLKEKLLEEIKDRVLRRGIARREIPPHPLRGRGKWGFGSDITGDVGHDTNADLALLNAGALSLTDLVEDKMGGDFEDLVYQQARDMLTRRKVAERTGVPIELQSERFPNATQLLAAMESRGDPDAEDAVLAQNGLEPAGAEEAAAQTPEPPMPTGLVTTHGKDAVKGLLEVLKQYNRGEITREQAVTVLVATYGMDAAEAESVVPG